MLFTAAVAELKAKMGGDAELGAWLEMTQERINDLLRQQTISVDSF